MALSSSRHSTADGAEALVASERLATDSALECLCDRELEALAPLVAEAVRYSLLGGGKRLRATLLLSAYRAAGGEGDAHGLAAAVEVIHAYSLVHDDLPCMDDDDVRRGRATVHRAFGEPVAVAAGLAMVPLAARCAFRAAGTLGLSREESGAIVRNLMRAAGAGGMIGGQLLDLEAEGRALAVADLEQIHRLKTGALIAVSAVVGGMAARASEPEVDALRRYGEAIGLAFQIADDVLDITATTDQLGKTAGKDIALQKSTYPALLGVAGAGARAALLVEEGCEALRGAGINSPALEALARFSVDRRS